MTGDLNDLQQLALLALLRRDDEEREEERHQELRTRILLAGLTPEIIPKVLDALDGQQRETELGVPEWAPELTDEQMEDYQPLSHEETSEAINLLRRFGFANTPT